MAAVNTRPFFSARVVTLKKFKSEKTLIFFFSFNLFSLFFYLFFWAIKEGEVTRKDKMREPKGRIVSDTLTLLTLRGILSDVGIPAF